MHVLWTKQSEESYKHISLLLYSGVDFKIIKKYIKWNNKTVTRRKEKLQKEIRELEIFAWTNLSLILKGNSMLAVIWQNLCWIVLSLCLKIYIKTKTGSQQADFKANLEHNFNAFENYGFCMHFPILATYVSILFLYHRKKKNVSKVWRTRLKGELFYRDE